MYTLCIMLYNAIRTWTFLNINILAKINVYFPLLSTIENMFNSILESAIK